MMATRTLRLCAWSGIAFLLLFFIGYWPLAGFLPPPVPSLTAQEVAAIYQSNTQAIRLGIVVMSFAVVLFIPFAVAIALQMQRIEGKLSALAWIQVLSACLTVTLLTVACLLWGAVAFRPERNAELTALLHDMIWILFIAPGAPACLQLSAVGFAVLGDRRPKPVFPRWSGYFSLWAALLFAPAQLAIFFRQGPFAWDGLFPFWVAFGVFSIWIPIFFFLLLKAIATPTQDELLTVAMSTTKGWP